MRIDIIIFFLFILYNHVTAQTSSVDSNFFTFQQLIHDLGAIAENNLEPSEILKNEFAQLRKTHRIANNSKNYKEFVRVKLVFEATRDCGLWNIVWKITDNEPNSELIWKQWQEYNNTDVDSATAFAECDELSALFAFIARSLGVENVGLFWPVYNHTIAVWTASDATNKPVRVLVPTSQIYITPEATLGTDEFEANKQKTIYNYTRKDIPLTYKIPASLAKMMIRQIKESVGKSSEFLQNRRNRQSEKLGGS